MKAVLCDINFILDIFLERGPIYAPAARIFAMIEAKQLKGYLCANSFPTLFYILAKELKLKAKDLRTLKASAQALLRAVEESHA